ncbi:MAG: hypothetical protein NUV57_01700 [archaeon]|nr:hypothetical protein [archaeon]
MPTGKEGNKKFVVELLPWIHHAGYPNHQDILEYIKKIPKNSVLALEIKPNYYDRLRHDYYYSPKGAHLALMQVIAECEKRNIEIVPLERAASRKYHPDKINADPLLDFLGNFEADRKFAEAILQAGRIRKKPIIYALTGLAHSNGIAEHLKNNGVTAKVNTEIFTGANKLFVLEMLASKHKQTQGLLFEARELNETAVKRLFNTSTIEEAEQKIQETNKREREKLKRKQAQKWEIIQERIERKRLEVARRRGQPR